VEDAVARRGSGVSLSERLLAAPLAVRHVRGAWSGGGPCCYCGDSLCSSACSEEDVVSPPSTCCFLTPFSPVLCVFVISTTQSCRATYYHYAQFWTPEVGLFFSSPLRFHRSLSVGPRLSLCWFLYTQMQCVWGVGCLL